MPGLETEKYLKTSRVGSQSPVASGDIGVIKLWRKNWSNGYTVTAIEPQQMAEKSMIIRRITTGGGDK